MLEPIATRITGRVLSSFVIGADDTGLRVLDRADPRGVKKGHIWGYVGDCKLVAFDYTKDWKSDGPANFLRRFRGFMQGDGYGRCRIWGILFSSGTTSRLRGVLLSRAAFIASAAAHSSNLPFQPSDRWLLALPFAHVGGLSIITRALISRTCVVLIGSSDRAEMLAAIERHSVSLLSLVPTVARDLLKEDRSDVLRTPRAVLLGGARAPLLLRKELKARGVRALASYGMTETCSQIATQGLADADDADSESCGLPLAGFELRIVDDAGASRNAGESGRIQVRGPALMRGYLGQAMLAPRAFFDTRDVGYLDERGHLFVVGRADETIVTGGENVFPAEVEAAMAGLAGVREVAAFGVPDERWGEIVAVALVLEPGADLDAIWQQARARLSSFRRPRRFAVAPSLPRSPNGKIDRRGLLRLPLAEVSS